MLLFISVVGRIKDWFDPGMAGRVLGLCIGGVLLQIQEYAEIGASQRVPVEPAADTRREVTD